MRRIPWLAFFLAIGLVACFVNEALPGVQEDQRLQQQSDEHAQLDATLLPGRVCSDAHNWSGRPTLELGKTMWYFIAVNAKGKRVKGEAVIRHLPAFGRQLAQ